MSSTSSPITLQAMRTGMGADIGAGMGAGVRADMCAGMRLGTCADMRADAPAARNRLLELDALPLQRRHNLLRANVRQELKMP